MALRVTLYDEPVLRKKGKPVSVFDDHLQTLVREMIETMHLSQGIGLAAQQVGELLQLCVIDVRDCGNDFYYNLDGKQPPLDLIMPLTLINPDIEVLSAEPTVYEEGCLSFPEIRGNVRRPASVRVRFQDVDGARHILDCDGILGRCVQHEVDHLNGILFIDRMDKKTLRRLEKGLKQLREASRK